VWRVWVVIYYISNPKQPAVKMCVAPTKAIVEKDVKSKLAAKKWLGWWANGKNLIKTINVTSPCFTRIWYQLLFFYHYPTTIPLQPFVGDHLGFYVFFIMTFLGATYIFIVRMFWIRFHFYLYCTVYCVAAYCCN